MKKICCLLAFSLCVICLHAQKVSLDLAKNWKFRKVGSTRWYHAEVPGTVHTDLLANKLMPDPFYADNEKKVQWVENEDWEYQSSFNVSSKLLQQKNIEIEFDGLDTDADVFLNGKKIITANNMFRQWTAIVRPLLKLTGNVLLIKFYSSSKIAKEKKGVDKILHPDNERIYVRKAQYQFGWDWGPRLVTAGIWKTARLVGWNQNKNLAAANSAGNKIKLITTRDSAGEAFYFTVNDNPVFIKGTNWIPADNFLPRAKKLRLYELLIKNAKEANINMLRVWGGGVYEDDDFYNLCDKYGILVWQDFMFAGAMYPGDESFLKNVEEEIRYQVNRLKDHPCIALWCGNNEIDEAWHNWGWQQQYKYSAADSAKLWNDYEKLFHQLIPQILKELDPTRPYWPSSPSIGWGRDSAYSKGDVHYWGVWWGKEPVEKYKEKVGRFNSEYGMQGMPDMKTIAEFSLPQDWDSTSSVMKVHQKHPFGYENIKYYIEQKFHAPKKFEDLVYVSQLMQADAIKTAIEAHRRNKPVTMGTMFWQWNDCWPVTSWSAIDYFGRKKALFYEVKKDFSKLVILPYTDSNFYWMKIVSDLDTTLRVKIETDFISFSDTVHNTLKATSEYEIKANGSFTGRSKRDIAKEFSSDGCIRFRVVQRGETIAENLLFLLPPKQLNLKKTKINWHISNGQLELVSDKFAYGVFINVPDGVELNENYFHLLPNEKKIVKFTSALPLETIRQKITIKSLVDTYLP